MRLLNYLNPYTLSETIRKKEPLAVQREIILQFLLIASTIWGVIGLVLYLLRTRITSDNLSLVLPFAIAIGIQVLLAVARGLPYQVRSYGLAFLILTESLETLFREGLSGNGMVYGVAFAAVIAVLIGPRAGFFAASFIIALQASVGWAMITGRLELPAFETMANSASSNAWISSVLAVLLVITTIAAAFFQLTRGFSSALDAQKKLSADLQKERDLLETRVKERTQQLSRKAIQLEAAQQVAAVLAHETDTHHLLSTAVDVIKDKFGFYHAGIFLNDPKSGYTLLEASTGSAGEKMLANKHRLRIGEVGIVGFVAANGEPRVTVDVLDDPNYYPNPLLPDTRSEMAVPLHAGNKPIGVLDIQSTVRNAFSTEDLEIISTIANQLSLALEKAQLVKDLETSLAELEANMRRATAQSWDAHLHTSRKHYAYQYNQSRVQPSPPLDTTETVEALKKGETTITSIQNAGQNESVIAIPIKLRGQSLGIIHMRVTGSKASPELVRLAENAVNRLAISLENVRLLEELQIRAERERLVGDISSKVRTATDVDAILRTAANEIGRSLGVAEVVVQLNPVKQP